MSDKIHEFYLLTCDGEYKNITLKDGRTLKCRVDCFCEEDDPETDESVPAILVVCEDGRREIIINEDVESIQK